MPSITIRGIGAANTTLLNPQELVQQGLPSPSDNKLDTSLIQHGPHVPGLEPLKHEDIQPFSVAELLAKSNFSPIKPFDETQPPPFSVAATIAEQPFTKGLMNTPPRDESGKFMRWQDDFGPRPKMVTPRDPKGRFTNWDRYFGFPPGKKAPPSISPFSPLAYNLIRNELTAEDDDI